MTQTTTSSTWTSNLKELQAMSVSAIQEAFKKDLSQVLGKEQRQILWKKFLEEPFPPALPLVKRATPTKIDDALIITHATQMAPFAQVLGHIPTSELVTGMHTLCEDLLGGVEYRMEFLLLLLPFVHNQFTLANALPLLSLLIRKYIPILLLQQGAEQVQTCMGLLFRLLLQYHDPNLGLSFKSSKFAPALFVQSWMTSWFVSSISPTFCITEPSQQTTITSAPSPITLSLLDMTCSLWDLLLIHDYAPTQQQQHMVTMVDHTTLPLFLCMQMLIKQFGQAPSTPPANLSLAYCHYLLQASANWNLSQLVADARALQRETPNSAKNQIMALLYPTSNQLVQEWITQFEQHVVLPLPTSEIIEKFKKQPATTTTAALHLIHYIIIDCRALKSYQFARLPTAIHIGAVGYDKQKMKAILDRFETAKGSHFVIYGTGKHLPDEDNLLHVIAMRFVVAQFPHVSIAPHGFKDCIKYITHHEIEFVRDAPAKEQEQAADATTTTTLQQVGHAVMHADWSQEVQQWTNKVKESSWWSSLFAKEQPAQVVSTNSTTNTTAITTTTSSSINNNNKPTTSTTTTASKASFSLDDDGNNGDGGDDNDNDTMVIVDAADLTTNNTDNSNVESDTLVKLDDLKQLGEPIHVFPCMQATTKQERFLVVTNTFVMNIQNHPQMQGYGVILWKRQLRGQVLKLAYHRENNKILSMVCKGTADQVLLLPNGHGNNKQQFQETFIMDKAVACAQLIQNYTMQLKQK